MSLADLILLKTLLVLWIFCAVVCEHQKRDVHRIIIKQRIPRSQKKSNPSHNHNHGHNSGHGHNHSGKNHGHGHGHKEGNRHHGSYEHDASFEDNGSFSRENSFEEFLQNNKGQKAHHHTNNRPHRHPTHTTKEDYEEHKREHHYRDGPKTTFHSEWIPLSSEQLHQHSHETGSRDRYRWRKDGQSKRHYLKSLKPPPLEITTSYPFQFDEATSVFPQLTGYSNTFTNFDLNKKTIESNQSPLIGTIEQPKLFSELKDDGERLKNHRPNYEVTELSPAGSKISTFISVPDDSLLESSSSNDEPDAEESVQQTFIEIKSTQKPRSPRGRGRVTYKAASTKV